MLPKFHIFEWSNTHKIFFFHKPQHIIASNWAIWNKAWFSTTELSWSIWIILSQFDWKAILKTPKKICGGNFVSHHKPTQWFNEESKKKHINMPYPLEKIPQLYDSMYDYFCSLLDTIWLTAAHALVTLDELVRISNCWISTWHPTSCSHIWQFSSHKTSHIYCWGGSYVVLEHFLGGVHMRNHTSICHDNKWLEYDFHFMFFYVGACEWSMCHNFTSTHVKETFVDMAITNL
jgi:hypothetical protein